MNRGIPRVVVRIFMSILFWVLWFHFYAVFNSRGAQVGVYWEAPPGIYIPIMVYPYVFGMALLVIVPFALYVQDDSFFHFLLIYIILTVVMFAIYYVYPVAMLRREYTGPLIADRLMRWIVGMDDPANCFPSNHCAIATLGCVATCYNRIPKLIKISTAILTALVCFSTVLVGQHYWIDIPTGVGLALLVGLAGFSVIEKRRNK